MTSTIAQDDVNALDDVVMLEEMQRGPSAASGDEIAAAPNAETAAASVKPAQPQFYYTERRRNSPLATRSHTLTSSQSMRLPAHTRCFDMSEDREDYDAARRIGERNAALRTTGKANSFAYGSGARGSALSAAPESHRRERSIVGAPRSPDWKGAAGNAHDLSQHALSVEVESVTPSAGARSAALSPAQASTPALKTWAIMPPTPEAASVQAPRAAISILQSDGASDDDRSASSVSGAVAAAAIQRRNTQRSLTSPKHESSPPKKERSVSPLGSNLHRSRSPAFSELSSAVLSSRAEQQPSSAVNAPSRIGDFTVDVKGFVDIRARLQALREQAAEEIRDEQHHTHSWADAVPQPVFQTSDGLASDSAPNRLHPTELDKLIAARQQAQRDIERALREDKQASISSAVKLPWGHDSHQHYRQTRGSVSPVPLSAKKTASSSKSDAAPRASPVAEALFAKADPDKSGFIRRTAAYKAVQEYFGDDAVGAVPESPAEKRPSMAARKPSRSPPPVPVAVLQREFDAVARNMIVQRPPARDNHAPGSIDVVAFQEMLDAVSKRKATPSALSPTPAPAAPPPPPAEPVRSSSAANSAPQSVAPTTTTATTSRSVSGGRELSPEAVQALRDLTHSLMRQQQPPAAAAPQSATVESKLFSPPRTTAPLSLAAMHAVAAARRAKEPRANTTEEPRGSPPSQPNRVGMDTPQMTAGQSRALLATCLAADRQFNGRVPLVTLSACLSQIGVFPSAAAAEEWMVRRTFVDEADRTVDYANVATVLRGTA